jgi:hypothetical protein
MALRHQRIGNGDAEPAGEMVVAGAGRSAASRGPTVKRLREGSRSAATSMMLSSMRATAGLASR